MTTKSDLDQVKAGRYELLANRWDEITSKPGEPFNFRRHRRGDIVTLDVENARRLVLAGSVRKPGEEDDASELGKETSHRPGDNPDGEGDGDVVDPNDAEAGQVDVDQDPTRHAPAAVKAYVGEDPAKAAAILELEQAGAKPRSQLVKWLEGVATAPPAPPAGGTPAGSGQA